MSIHDLPIRKRLTLSYMLLIALVVFLICLSLFIVFFTSMRETSREQMGLQLDNLSDSIVSRLESVVHIGNSITGDMFLMDVLQQLEWKDLSDHLNEGYIERRSSPLISRLILINRNLQLLDPINNRFIYQDAILMNPDFTEFLSGNTQIYLARPGIFPIDIPAEENVSDLTIALYQRIYNEQNILAGYLLAVLDKEYLLSTVWERSIGDDFAGIALFDHHNERIHTVGTPFTSKAIGIDFSGAVRPGSFLKKTGGERYFVLLRPVSGFNWTIAALVPYGTVFNRLFLAFFLIIIIGFLFIIFSLGISMIIARNITHPLLEVTAAMHRWDDSQSLETIAVKASGELGYLVAIYNRMVNSINTSIRSMYEEQEKKNEAELMSLQYELDFLQAQIHPHFIHNTLNAIGYLAEKNGNQQLYHSLQAFNTLLRAAIGGTRETISLAGELELVRNFEQIQRLRYGETFIIEYAIADCFLNVEVPKLILQPVVENAIFYGEGKAGTTHIRIGCRKINGSFELTVSDNGPGMETELDSTRKSDARKFNRVGLQNIDERIHILFGNTYGLSISSSESGTTVSISLPEALC